MEAQVTQIGKYQIVGVLGQGAMGVVYQGFDPMIRRYVAIKTISGAEIENSENEIYLRFQREARAAGNLNHANIVSVYEYGEDNGLSYIVMEHVEGQTLADRMKQNQGMIIEESTSIIKSVLSALSHAHARGVVHRDIKPANIILARNGIAKVADFGIARIEASDLTQAGTIIGTPGYMSPEQLKGEVVDARSDIFSAGVILYEMLTGQKAFPGSTIASIIYNVINKELPPPSELRQAVPAGLDAVVRRAVAKSADARFESALQFVEALDAALQKRTPPDSFSPDGIQIPASLPDQPAALEHPAGRASRTGLWVAIGGLVVVAVLIAIFKFRPAPQVNQAVIQKQYLPGEIFKDCETCPSLVVVPPGQFVQGTPSAAEFQLAHEAPVHLVSIDYPLAVGRYEVTRKQYARFVSETGHPADGCNVYKDQWVYRPAMNWNDPGYVQAENHPATCVSWDDAQAYVEWLSRETGHKYRLLSASEWEYTARDGGRFNGLFNADRDSICEKGNVADRSAAGQYRGWQVFECNDNNVHTAPAGAFEPNALGVFDMAGNVFEWVADCWNENYQNAPTSGAAWAQGDCTRHELKGGSWFSRPEYLRAAFRNSFAAGYRSSSFGFRVARELTAQKHDG